MQWVTELGFYSEFVLPRRLDLVQRIVHGRTMHQLVSSEVVSTGLFNDSGKI